MNDQNAQFAVPMLPAFASHGNMVMHSNPQMMVAPLSMQPQKMEASMSMAMSQGVQPSTSNSFAIPSVNMAPSSSSINSSNALPSGIIRRRRFSTAKIQPTRIKKVMQSDEEIGRMVQSVPVSIGRAMEHFAEKFLQAAADATLYSNSKTLTPAHMKQAMISNPHFRFLEPILKDIVLPQAALDAANAKYAINLRDQQLMMEKRNTEAASSLVNQMYAQHQFVIPPVGDQNSGMGQQWPMMPPGPMNMMPAMGVGQNDGCQQYMPPIMQPFPPALGVSQSSLPMSPTTPTTAIANGLMNFVKIMNDSEKTVRVNGKRTSTDVVDDDKPKRGRPKKKKAEKCIDDELVAEAARNIAKEDKDRELMPPPALPTGPRHA